ncbi:MAG: EAL domain-containing protein [Actinomycetota bacterium]|nr:EAL domain-containing protein [Actinomycetota bacterium]
MREGYDSAQHELVARPARLLAEVLADDAVRPVFQPIVDLPSGTTIGFEALTRGPAGSPLESPLALLAKMREAGRLGEFDQACRDAALARAALAGVAPPLTVFLNAEPELVEGTQPAAHDQTWVEAPRDLRCVIEVTERALLDRPAELMQATSGVRDLAWGVALDGRGRRSRLAGADDPPAPRRHQARHARGPGAGGGRRRRGRRRGQRARGETGALVLAEGIEHEDHLRTALAVGATLGQGFHFGRPAPIPTGTPAAGPTVRFLGSGPAAEGSRRSAWSVPGAPCGAGISSSSAPSRSTSPARRGPWGRRASSSPASGRGRRTCRAPARSRTCSPRTSPRSSAPAASAGVATRTSSR